MKIFFVLDETPFYHPDFFAGIVRGSKDQIVGVGIVTEIPEKNDVGRYLIKNWRCLEFREMAILAMRKYRMLTKNALHSPSETGPFYSVKKVCEAFGIANFAIKQDINQPEYIEKIRELSPDVIVSSNSLIFKQEILSLPKKVCLNRHSSLLPSYGGVWPVLRGYINGEKEFGVSVHTMEEKIDRGLVLSQKKFVPGPRTSIADIYERCFELSVEAVLQAIDKVRDNDLSHVSTAKSSYYSFPKLEDWQKFRERGGRFV